MSGTSGSNLRHERFIGLRRVRRKTGLPAIVLGEYLFGIQQSRLKASYQSWLQANLPFFDLLPIVRETAERYSEIRRELRAAGTPIPTNDLWIAALARHHRMPLVTRDGHFRAIQGLRILALVAQWAARPSRQSGCRIKPY